MKIEISNKDFITYLILILLIVAIIIMWMKMDYLRFEAQLKINTQSIMNIDNYLQQQMQQKANAPVFELAPKKPDKK